MGSLGQALLFSDSLGNKCPALNLDYQIRLLHDKSVRWFVLIKHSDGKSYLKLK